MLQIKRLVEFGGAMLYDLFDGGVRQAFLEVSNVRFSLSLMANNSEEDQGEKDCQNRCHDESGLICDLLGFAQGLVDRKAEYKSQPCKTRYGVAGSYVMASHISCA